MIAFGENNMFSNNNNKVNSSDILTKAGNKNSDRNSGGCSCGKVRLVTPNAPERVLLWDVLNELSVNVREISRSPHCCWLVFWVLVFLVLIFICSVQLWSLLDVHFSYKSYTTYDISHERELPYPLMTFCTEGWMKESAWNESLEKYHKEAQPYIRAHYSHAIGGRIDNRHYDDFDNFNIHHPNEVFDMKEFWKQNHIHLKDVLLACQIGRLQRNGEECAEQFLTATFYMDTMTCFTLNITEKMQDVDGYAGTSFFVLRNAAMPSGQKSCNMDEYLPAENCDWQVYFDSKHAYHVLNPSNLANIIHGHSAYIGLQLTISERLGDPYGDCEEIELKYFRKYSRNACALEILYNFTVECANCSRFGVIPLDSTPADLETCTLEQLMFCNEEDILEERIDRQFLFCPNECHEEHFTITTDYAGNKPAPLMKAYETSEVTSIGVYHRRLNKIIVAQHPSLTLADLASKVGAALSLWLGFKVMTFLQFIYYSGWEIKRRLTG